MNGITARRVKLCWFPLSGNETYADVATMVLGLQNEICPSEEARYDHRPQGDLLVAQGLTYPEAGRELGDAPRTVECRVRRLGEHGLAGLAERALHGRPKRLSARQFEEALALRRQVSSKYGLNRTLLDGKILQAWLARQ